MISDSYQAAHLKSIDAENRSDINTGDEEKRKSVYFQRAIS